MIITIIVLIILAAVSISAVFNTGIIDTTVNGAVNYAEAQRKEQVTFDELDSNLQDIIKQIESYDIGGSTPDTTGLKPGDIINYNPVVDDNFDIPTYGTRATLVDGIDSLTWKIWKIENDNYIIVPDTPTIRYLNIAGGASGYNDLVQILNAYCRKYYSDVENEVYARSVNMTDIESSMTEAGRNAKSSTYNATYNTIISPITKTNYPGIYSLETSDTIGQSDSPSDDIYAPWDGVTVKDDGEIVYSAGYKMTTYFFANDEIIDKDYFDAITEELFFSDKGHALGYWIATRSVDKTVNLEDIPCASFGSRGVSSDGSLNFFRMYYTNGTAYDGGSEALKPVVTIPKSKISKYIAQ